MKPDCLRGFGPVGTNGKPKENATMRADLPDQLEALARTVNPAPSMVTDDDDSRVKLPPDDVRALLLEAALALRALRDAPVGGWIPVTERLPEMDVPVWLLDAATGHVFLGGRGEGEDGWLWCNAYGSVHMCRDGTWDSDLESDDDYTATHWQPLPERLVVVGEEG